MLDLARDIVFLHKQSILHKDLKAINVLIYCAPKKTIFQIFLMLLYYEGG
jgi:hypothetical protein